MQQSADQDFASVTLAILHGGKIAVMSHPPKADGSTWSLPEAERAGRESAAECALRIARATLDLEMPSRRLNWPVSPPDRSEGTKTWFFAAWITPAEWTLLGADGAPKGTVMLQIEAFLEAESVPRFQRDALALYLAQSERAG